MGDSLVVRSLRVLFRQLRSALVGDSQKIADLGLRATALEVIQEMSDLCILELAVLADYTEAPLLEETQEDIDEALQLVDLFEANISKFGANENITPKWVKLQRAFFQDRFREKPAHQRTTWMLKVHECLGEPTYTFQ